MTTSRRAREARCTGARAGNQCAHRSTLRATQWVNSTTQKQASWHLGSYVPHSVLVVKTPRNKKILSKIAPLWAISLALWGQSEARYVDHLNLCALGAPHWGLDGPQHHFQVQTSRAPQVPAGASHGAPRGSTGHHKAAVATVAMPQGKGAT